MVYVSPLLLLLIALLTVLVVGVRHRWRLPALVWAVFTVLVVAGMLEVLVFFVEWSIDGCAAG